MSNLLSLPQFPVGTTIEISSNADFAGPSAAFFIGVPNFQSSPILIQGNLTASSYNITGIPSTLGLVPGMAVHAFGLQSGSVIAPGGVGVNTLTLNNSALQTVNGITVSVLPPPLDLTGIVFSSMLRKSATDSLVLLAASTDNGLMVNGAQAGTFGWNVPRAKLPGLFVKPATGQITLVMGVHATDDTGAIVDMCAENGPLPVIVNASAAA